MMEIESPTCFRATTTLPLKSTSSSLSLTSPVTGGVSTENSPFTQNRNNLYTGSMVVESQTHTFRSMTPDPLPETAEKTEKVDLPETRQQTLPLPPEGAMTPGPDTHQANQRTPLSVDYSVVDKKTMEYLMSPTKASYPKSPVEYNRSPTQPDYHSDKAVPIYKGMDPAGFTNNPDISQTPEGIVTTEKTFAQTEGCVDQMDANMTRIYSDLRLDRSPPNLSPKTSDTDLDMQSTGSPSQNSERRRRKPTLEDIVRRMREVETDYTSEEELTDDEDCYNQSMSLNTELQGQDEVDGDMSMRMPILTSQAGQCPLEQMQKMDVESNTKLPIGSNNLTENNNVLTKPPETNGKPEEAVSDFAMKMKDDENRDMNGIPLPATPKSDILSPPSSNSEPIFKQPGMMASPKMNGWLHGAFNGFNMFPFQPSPPELPFARFLSPFENKFSSPEVEKDYLKCQFCERTFRRQKNLENHVENTHHGKGTQRKKPGEPGVDMYFKCTHCPYTTKHQSNLYVHLRIHTGERPYICGACGVQYSQSHSLKSHIINKHDGIMSYYIKEKRTRSPRGLGYLATHSMQIDSPMFKMPSAPLVPPSLQQLPGNTNGLNLQHSPQQQQPIPLQHSPLSMAANMHQNSLLPSLQQQSPGMQPSPNSHPPHPAQQSPGQQHHPHLPHQHPPGAGPQQQQQQSPHQHLGPQSHHQQQQMQHHFTDSMDVNQKSLELAKLGMSYFPYLASPMFGGKPNAPFHMNGHGPSPQGPISPHFNGLNLQMKQQQQQQQQQQASQQQQQQKPRQQQQNDVVPSANATTLPGQFSRNQTPLQEIQNNKIRSEDNFGAIDLSKKSKQEALDLAMQEHGQKCLERGDCPNCLHLLKLRMLRSNVVRMLSILVPNLNFEEKGINAEGDSVDDLLRDVIESNIHDEEMSE